MVPFSIIFVGEFCVTIYISGRINTVPLDHFKGFVNDGIWKAKLWTRKYIMVFIQYFVVVNRSNISKNQ